MPLGVVLFDLWGTLVVDDSAAPAVMGRRGAARVRMATEALAKLGFDFDRSRVELAFRAASDEHSAVHAEGRDLSTHGRTELYLRHLDPSLAERLDDQGWRHMHQAILTAALSAPPAAMPGAIAVLDECRALGLRIGLISNAGITPGYVLRQIMESHDLLRRLDHTIFSDEVEVAKPSPAIFQRALEAFRVAPEEAVFVGDQPVLDVLGPRNAGIWSVQIGNLRENGIEPHTRISALVELVPALRGLGLLQPRR
jgi:HAD superfamily hydrolase (TIGR01509 family)